MIHWPAWGSQQCILASNTWLLGRWPQTRQLWSLRASADWSLQTGEWPLCTKMGKDLAAPESQRTQVRTVPDRISLLGVLSISALKSESSIRITTFHHWKLRVMHLTHEIAATFAPPDCSRRLNPDSLLWSMFSMTVHPLNAPWETKHSGSSAEYRRKNGNQGFLQVPHAQRDFPATISSSALQPAPAFFAGRWWRAEHQGWSYCPTHIHPPATHRKYAQLHVKYVPNRRFHPHLQSLTWMKRPTERQASRKDRCKIHFPAAIAAKYFSFRSGVPTMMWEQLGSKDCKSSTTPPRGVYTQKSKANTQGWLWGIWISMFEKIKIFFVARGRI